MTVYFIGGDFGAVKIGYTSSDSASDRLVSLQTGNPLQLRILAQVPGEQADEKSLHYEFSKERMQGEWFRISARVASLIGYVREFKTIDGWREACANPERHAAYVAEFGTVRGFAELDRLPVHEARWRAAKPGEYKTGADESIDWRDLRIAWKDVTHGLDYVRHFASPERYLSEESGWANSSGALLYFNGKSINETAALLGSCRNQDETISTWIQVCIKDYIQRDQNCEREDLRRAFPRAREMREACEGVVRRSWHPMVTSTLPIPFQLPAHCSLSPREFARACATHYVLVMASHTPLMLWADGACVDLAPHRKAA